jgi:PSP1 C-terminal conserved region
MNDNSNVPDDTKATSTSSVAMAAISGSAGSAGTATSAAATNKTTGSPRSISPTSLKALEINKGIWNEPPSNIPPTTQRRQGTSPRTLWTCASNMSELSSEDEIDETNCKNGESKAGFISRRPSMTAELEIRMRQVRVQEEPERSGPSSPSGSSKWGFFGGMNWNPTGQPPLRGERTTPPQDAPPISPFARFQQSPLDPPAQTTQRQVSSGSTSQPFNPSSSRPRYSPVSQPIDPSQRVQRSQSFSVGDGSTFGQTFLSSQTTSSSTLNQRSSIFIEEPQPIGGGRHYKSSTGFPSSSLSRAPIAEEADELDPGLARGSKEGSPSRYQDRGRSLSTSAASHGYSRQKLGDGPSEDVMDEPLYEEDEEAALSEFEPLSRSRTLPAETNLSSPISSTVNYGSRFGGLGTDRERLERQRGVPRESPRVVEEIPQAPRRGDSFSAQAWDDARAHRSPPRPVDYPGVQSGYDAFETSASHTDSGSLHSFPNMRDYGNADVQNYFNNDNERRRMAAEQFQLYQMQQNRYQRYPSSNYGPSSTSQDPPRPYPIHDPDQFTLHFVKFKASRMDVFYLAKEKKLDLKAKDYVIVDGDRGTDLGMVSKVNVTEAEARALTAQLQREQAAATAANQNGMNANAIEAIQAAANQVSERDVTVPKKYIHRLAVKAEIDGLQMKMQDEAQAKQVCEMKVQQRGLQMDILDVEYQWYLPCTLVSLSTLLRTFWTATDI